MNNFAIWLLISLAYLSVLINAVPRNSTVDDTDPSVRYLDSKGAVDPDVCIGCGLPRVDSARFFNGTGTVVPGLVEFSFVGTQFLVFVFLTSVTRGTASGVVEIDGTAAPFQYTHPEFDVFQFPAYSSPSLSNGNHTIRMQLDPALFDFFTYVSDPDAVSSSSASSTTGASESPGPTNTHNVGSPKAKAPVGAIAGGVIGGVALIALALVAFLFLRRRRHSGPSPKSVENHAVPFTGDKFPPGSTAQETDPPTLVEQVQRLGLKEIMRRLEAPVLAAAEAPLGARYRQ
ncbi:hypothetical protein C8J57DRAFT_1248240 [Mycena rebaudengoi]|nr:hypothetical protein C8J57DRAFT_1248240 [Mycena rebaudengoi]